MYTRMRGEVGSISPQAALIVELFIIMLRDFLYVWWFLRCIGRFGGGTLMMSSIRFRLVWWRDYHEERCMGCVVLESDTR